MNLQLLKSTGHVCTSSGYKTKSISHLITMVALPNKKNKLVSYCFQCIFYYLFSFEFHTLCLEPLYCFCIGVSSRFLQTASALSFHAIVLCTSPAPTVCVDPPLSIRCTVDRWYCFCGGLFCLPISLGGIRRMRFPI